MGTAKVVGDAAVAVSIRTSCKAEVRKVRIEGLVGRCNHTNGAVSRSEAGSRSGWEKVKSSEGCLSIKMLLTVSNRKFSAVGLYQWFSTGDFIPQGPCGNIWRHLWLP